MTFEKEKREAIEADELRAEEKKKQSEIAFL